MAVTYHYGKFPPKIKLDDEIHALVNQARTELGRYDGFLSSMLNSQTLLSPLFTQEAVVSSKIEGTQSTLSEVLEFEGRDQVQNGLSENKKNDLQEVLNYRYALNKAIDLLSTNKLPLSQRLMKEIHKELMQGVRGKNKAPGKYRKTPVWIGPDKSDMAHARFVPIDAHLIPDAMSWFERYIHNETQYDDLIKVAILHAEIEAIHPFLDGNGRLGRIFIPLYLSEKQLISSPSFYISNYFEKNRDSYYDLLLHISKSNDWLTWCKFFIRGVSEQSQENLERARNIISYYRELKDKIPQITKSQYGITALDFIFKKNYFHSLDFFEHTSIPKPTAQRLLKTFVDQKILYCAQGKGRQPNFYVFKHLIDIADGK